MSTRARIIAALNIAALVLVTIVSGLMVTALLEKPWLSYPNTPFPALEQSVRPGEIVHLLVERCSTWPGTRNYGVSHQLVGGPQPILMQAETVSISQGCFSVVSDINKIPEGLSLAQMPAGTYHVEGTGESQGTVRTFIAHWSSQPFEIKR